MPPALKHQPNTTRTRVPTKKRMLKNQHAFLLGLKLQLLVLSLPLNAEQESGSQVSIINNSSWSGSTTSEG